MKQKRIITEDFFIGNLGDIKSTNEILDTYNKLFNKNINELTENDRPGLVADCNDHPEIRKCSVSWLSISENNFIDHGLKQIVKNVNDMVWKITLDDEWQTDIQFTKYIGKGEHYDWHKDYYENEDPNDSMPIRRISVVYCLSKKSDYIGGEFQIRTNAGGVYTTKFDFGDFIVFPSNKLHRVKPLKSGTRITMVGWYR